MRRLNIAIALYVFGYLVFTTAALFGIYHEWDTAYFTWSSFAHGGAVLWSAIYSIVPPSKKRDVFAVCVAAYPLSAWEIVSLLSGIDINNPIAVLVEFLLIISVITYFGYYEFAKKFKYL